MQFALRNKNVDLGKQSDTTPAQTKIFAETILDTQEQMCYYVL